jgi:hypothetical protein
MIDEVNKVLATYQQEWTELVAKCNDEQFFTSLKPTAIGWKTEDRAKYSKLVAELHDQSDLVIEKWMNGRWIAKIHLKDRKLVNGVEIIKVMERRPGSSDLVGLDHVDFYTKSTLDESKAILGNEQGLKWTQENNDILAGYDWLSVWFSNTEAKIKSDTILDIVGAELKNLNDEILA